MTEKVQEFVAAFEDMLDAIVDKHLNPPPPDQDPWYRPQHDACERARARFGAAIESLLS